MFPPGLPLKALLMPLGANMNRVSLRQSLPPQMGSSAQSTSCSPLGSDNELGRHGETEKELLCAPGDSPVPGAKITPLVLFINSGGTGCERHADVATAGSASPTCLGLIPCGAGDALQCLCLSIPLGAGKKTPGGRFKIKTRFELRVSPWPSPKEPPPARIRAAVNFPDPHLVWYPQSRGQLSFSFSSSRAGNREGKSFLSVCVHTQNEIRGDSS